MVPSCDREPVSVGVDETVAACVPVPVVDWVPSIEDDWRGGGRSGEPKSDPKGIRKPKAGPPPPRAPA